MAKTRTVLSDPERAFLIESLDQGVVSVNALISILTAIFRDLMAGNHWSSEH
jgi:hypothetical protein